MSRLGHLTLLMALGLFLSACEEDGSYVKELGAMWMEWPAQVQEENPVSVLIVGDMTCGAEYVRRYEVDQTNRTVQFTPYEIVPESPCVGILPSLFVDRIDVLDLRAGTYQLQSRDQTFGEVVVTSDPPDAPPLVGAGVATFVRDPDSCLRLRPAMTYFPHMLPLQDQADTTADWTNAFVTGHIIDATNPVCGVTRIFHLVARD